MYGDIFGLLHYCFRCKRLSCSAEHSLHTFAEEELLLLTVLLIVYLIFQFFTYCITHDNLLILFSFQDFVPLLDQT